MPFEKINTVEQADHELVFVYPKDTDGITITPTGDSETERTEGYWDVLFTQAATLAAAYEGINPPTEGQPGYEDIKLHPETGKIESWPGIRTTITLSRKAGWLCDMTTRREKVIFSMDDAAEEDDEEENEEEEGGDSEDEEEEADIDDLTAEDFGKSRSAPTYDYNITMIEQPILTHPMFDSLNSDQILALQMYMNGANRREQVQLENGGSMPLKDMLAGLDSKLLTRVRRTPSYLDMQVEVTCSYEVARSTPAKKLTASPGITDKAPGPMKAPQGRNFLHVGTGISSTGKKCTVRETYIMSGRNGWDEELYGKPQKN